MKKNVNNIEHNEQAKPVSPPISLPATDKLRTDLAIGTLTLYATALVLFFVNSAIYYNYHPDIAAILDKVVPISVYDKSWFAPEPVERLQFQLSALLTPFIIFFTYLFINKKRTIFSNKPALCTSISIAGVVIFILFLADILTENLVNMHDKTNAWLFNNNLFTVFNPFIAITGYCAIAYLFYLYYKAKETTTRKIITSVIIYGIVAFVILDTVLYDVFNLATTSVDISGETNPVFYAITQVYAGKSLLVNINCLYGSYAWVLLPVFKLIGLSTYKIGMVLAILNGISFSLIYLGLRKIIKQDLLSFIVFMCLVFWQYWQTRLPFDTGPRPYYQYSPIRTLFPSIAFFLIASYYMASLSSKRILLPLLALASSLAILWNLDTGIVVYAAVFIALVLSSLDAPSFSDSVKRSKDYAAWMFGALLFVLALFFLSAKIRSGAWPDLRHYADFQAVFYISGFFMLPMTAIHFWNLPVIIYLVAGIYCVYHFKKTYPQELPVIAFLFILGIGLMAYFQGRSYDTTITIVMYPSIIILGIFCSKLLPGIVAHKPRFHESILFFLIPFIFLADGACSMIYYSPSIHSFAWNSATGTDTEKEEKLAERMNFIRSNIPPKDTVLILAKNYECYYYASGQYYNPLDLPGSTEILFKSELYTLLDCIKTTKYPIVCDARYYWPYMDTIIKTMAKYTTIQTAMPGDYTLVLVRPGKKPVPDKLVADGNTIYHNHLGEFNKYLNQSFRLNMAENFTVEFFATLDTGKLLKNNILFCTLTQDGPFSGLLMKQDGDDLTQYSFAYGNGTEWCKSVVCKLSCTTENHIVIKVRKNMVTAFNNNNLCGEANTNSSIKNSAGIFYINPAFSGTLSEMKISDQ